MADIHKYTSKEVLNKVLLDSSGDAVNAFSHTTSEALNAALDDTNSRLNVSLEGGTISGDVTISGDLTVEGSATNTFDETVVGQVIVGTTLGSAAVPSLAFGDGNTGFYEASDNSMRISIAGSECYLIDTYDIRSQTARSFALDRSGSTVTNPVFTFNGDVNTGMASSAADTINFITGGTEKVRIDSSGNVGIGTASPEASLHIERDLNDATADDLGDWDNHHLVIVGGSSTNDTASILLTTTADTYGGSAIVSRDVANYQSELSFWTKQSDSAAPPTRVMTLDSSGNVGIGTDSPDQMLEIEKNDTVNLHLDGISAGLLIDKNAAANQAHVIYQTNGSTNWQIGVPASGDIGDGSDFNIGTSSDASDSKIFIDSGTGNVGIGTAAPSTTLHLTNTANDATAPELRLQNTRATGAGSDGDDAGTISFYAQDAGSNAEAMSTILSEVNLNTTGSTAGKLTFKTMHQNSSTALLTLSGWAGGSHSSTVSSAVFNTSLVGIGATPTAAKLEIHGGAYDTSLIIKGSGANTGIKFIDSAGNVDGLIYADSGEIGLLDDDESWGIRIITDTSTSLYVNNAIKLLVDANSRISLSNNDGGSASNTIFGYQAGAGINSGTAAHNVFIGHETADAITEGNRSVAVGSRALGTDTTGVRNVAIGFDAFNQNNSGNYNVGVGQLAGFNNVTGSHNTYVGSAAGQGGTGSNSDNVGVGANALFAVTTGSSNVAIGKDALDAITDAAQIIGIGENAGGALASSTSNGTIAIGHYALSVLSGAVAGNVVIGKQAGQNTTGANNTYVGLSAGLGASGADANNVGVGANALLAITTGAGNTSLGKDSSKSVTDGHNNVAIGNNALETSTSVGLVVAIGDDAMKSGDATAAADGTVAVGASALLSLTEGAGNTAVGYQSATAITTGGYNTSLGYQSYSVDTDGSYNVALGWKTLRNISGSDKNIAIGYSAMSGMDDTADNLSSCIAIGYEAFKGSDNNTTGTTTGANGTIAIGHQSLTALTSGAQNTAVGYTALATNADGSYNTAIGYESLYTFEADSANHGDNTAVGSRAGKFVFTGTNNTFLGKSAGEGITGTPLLGNSNTAVGNQAGLKLQGAAHENTFLGSYAGDVLETGSDNTCIGYGADTDDATAINQIVIGHSTTGVADNSVTLGNADVTATYLASGASDANILYIGDTANAKMTVGVTINQAASDDEVLAFKSSDVSHGVTNVAETDTYASFGKYDGNNGGMVNRCLSDGAIAYYLQAVATTVDTTHTASGTAAITMDASKANGVSNTTLGTDANVFAVKMDGSAKFIVDNEGDLFADGSATTVYDSYDDAQLVRAYDTHKAPKAIIQSKFDDYISYNKDTLVDAGIIAEDDEEGNKGFVNVTGLQRLHNGAIWQQYTEMQKMKELMYETMVEMIGKDKADAKLKDHDIKLLDKNTSLN